MRVPIITPLGRAEVESIYRRGVWVVVPTIDLAGFETIYLALSHLPSGGMIPFVFTESDGAIELCRRVHALLPDFQDDATFGLALPFPLEATHKLREWAVELGARPPQIMIPLERPTASDKN